MSAQTYAGQRPGADTTGQDHAAPVGGHSCLDQASGLRRLFDGRSTRAVGVVSNPAVAWSGLLIEHLAHTLGAAGLHTLVVDASETAPEPGEWTALDLRWAIDVRCDQFSYLGARGLIRGHVDANGRAHAFLRRAADSAPWADVLIVHAPATDLMRVFSGQDWRPVVLADTTPTGVMQAYRSMKSISRCGLSTFDLLMESAAHPVLGPRLAMRLADSASRFLSWPVGVSVVVQSPAGADPSELCRLQDLARAQLAQAPVCAVHRPASTPAFH